MFTFTVDFFSGAHLQNSDVELDLETGDPHTS